MSLEAIEGLPTWGPVLLLGVIAAVVVAQRFIGWRTYRRIHRLKIRLLPLVDRYTSLFVVSNKQLPEDDAEYIDTVEPTVRDTFETLTAAGGSPHLLNSIKRLPDGRYSASHVVCIHSDISQTEAYLFDTDGGTLVYAHHETSVLDPEGHLSDPQTDGDPRGVVAAALG